MTSKLAREVTPGELRRHALDLAVAFDIHLLNHGGAVQEGFAMPDARIVAIAEITEETSYIIALHEMGHIAGPGGFIRTHANTESFTAKLHEEQCAWAWAEHYSLIWTVAMEQVKAFGLKSYTDAVEKQIRDELNRRLRPRGESMSSFLGRRTK